MPNPIYINTFSTVVNNFVKHHKNTWSSVAILAQAALTQAPVVHLAHRSILLSGAMQGTSSRLSCRVPLAPRLAPCAAPMDVDLLPMFKLPRSAIDILEPLEASCVPLAAPRLRPAPDPLPLQCLPPLALPEAYGSTVELSDLDCGNTEEWQLEFALDGSSEDDDYIDVIDGEFSFGRGCSLASTAIGDVLDDRCSSRSSVFDKVISNSSNTKSSSACPKTPLADLQVCLAELHRELGHVAMA